MAITAQSILTYARQISQTDSNGLSDTLGLAFANDALQNFTRSLVERNINASQIQEAYTNLGTQSPNTYAFPADMWALKTIEVNFVDTNQNNYLQASNVEVANIQRMSFDWLRLNQPNTLPLFANYGDTYEIFPTPAIPVTAGIKIIYFLTPTEYSATSDTVVYPATLDFRCIGARVAGLYKSMLGDTNDALLWNTEYQNRLDDIIRILAPASQQPIEPQRLQITGFEF